MMEISLLAIIVTLALLVGYIGGYLIGEAHGARAERGYKASELRCYVATSPFEDDENAAREMLGAIARAAKGASGEGDE